MTQYHIQSRPKGPHLASTLINKKCSAVPATCPRQHGFAMIALIVIIGTALVTAVFALFNGSRIRIDVEAKDLAVLAQIKAALISYAATNPARPGELPCPDRGGGPGGLPDGLDNDGVCAAGELGRVPWMTLGIPEPKDSSGETIWYAISGNFRNLVSNPGSQINSDTLGTLTVYGSDWTTILTTQAVAVLFAPRTASGAQNRSTVSDKTTPSNYLDNDVLSGKNNAVTNGPYFSGQPLGAFNDIVAFITTTELLPPVEQYVAGAVKATLESYRTGSTCKCYPWAAPFATGGPSTLGNNRGKLPSSSGALPEPWTVASQPFPAWFFANSWESVIYYSVAQMNAEHQGTACATTTCLLPSLVVDGTSGPSIIVFTPGATVAGHSRPSMNLADYLRDPENFDDSNDLYLTPSTSLSRNRMYTDTKPSAIP